jgi:hypothetical protein
MTIAFLSRAAPLPFSERGGPRFNETQGPSYRPTLRVGKSRNASHYHFQKATPDIANWFANSISESGIGGKNS